MVLEKNGISKAVRTRKVNIIFLLAVCIVGRCGGPVSGWPACPVRGEPAQPECCRLPRRRSLPGSVPRPAAGPRTGPAHLTAGASCNLQAVAPSPYSGCRLYLRTALSPCSTGPYPSSGSSLQPTRSCLLWGPICQCKSLFNFQKYKINDQLL